MTRLSCAALFLLLAANASGLAQSPAPATDAPLAVRTGASSGPVQVTVFCDIEEEACQRLVVVLGHVVETHPEQVGVTFRHRAARGHERSSLAYRSALAAARQGKGWEMLDMACANPDRLDDAGLLGMAAQLQLDVERFRSDTAAGDVTQVLEDDVAAVKAQKVETVPTVFVNGTRLPDASTFDALDAAVKAAIK